MQKKLSRWSALLAYLRDHIIKTSFHKSFKTGVKGEQKGNTLLMIAYRTEVVT